MSRLLAKQAAGTLGLKIGLLGLSFVTTIFLARTLDVSEFGLYSYAISWALLLQIPSSLGLDLILGREIAAYRLESDWASINGVISWSNRIVLVASISLTLLAIICFWLVHDSDSQYSTNAIFIALATVPILSLTKLRKGAMRGFDQVVKGQIPENIIQPLVFIGLLVVGLVLVDNFSASWVVGIRFASASIAFLCGLVLLRQTVPKSIESTLSKVDSRKWISGILPFMFISCAHIINTRMDILMLGAIIGTEPVGIYTAASRGAGLGNLALASINMSLGPKIVLLYKQGDMVNLQKLITKSTRMIVAITLPIVVFLGVFGSWFLQLFGTDFVQGKVALTILCAGQLINASCGSSGVLLDMTGYERDSAIGIGMSALLNIILNSVLIPNYGLEGAAIASIISLASWNIFLVVRVRQRLKINTTIFAI